MRKLVRDKISAISKKEQDGRVFSTPKDRAELIQFLAAKIKEESEEVIQEVLDQEKDKLTEEIGDLLEVIDEVCKIMNISSKEIKKIKSSKKKRKGGFSSHSLMNIVPK